MFISLLAALSFYVIDGDTLSINNSRHRLYCIDSPELAQPFSIAAKERLEEVLESSQDIRVEVIGRDRYKRSISKIYIGGKDVSKTLVEEGYAYVYRQFCNDESFNALEQQAKEKGLNIWSQQLIELPWDYRNRLR